MISDKVIGRFSLYRRLLGDLSGNGARNIFSHELALASGVTAAQVRRDIMNLGYSGNPNKGYDIIELSKSIGSFLDTQEGQKAALIGVGNLGRAILNYFSGRRPRLTIAASFDKDPMKFGRVIHGCRCFPLDELPKVINEYKIGIAVLTVPMEEAQRTAETLVAAGIKGILNFAPIHLKVPHGIYVEDIDMTMSLEKVAYFARQSNKER